MKKIPALLSILTLIAACNGQVKTSSVPSAPDSKGQEGQATIKGGASKLVRTQGTGWGANLGCALQDRAGNLWFGTSGEGVYRYDGKSFTNFTTQDGLGSNDVGCILEDKAGYLLLGTGDGVFVYDPFYADVKGAKPFAVLQRPGIYMDMRDQLPIHPANDPYRRNIVASMFQDQAGNIWFGTNRGVFRYDYKTLRPLLYQDGAAHPEGQPLGFVTAILEARNGDLWFGSFGNEGVYRYTLVTDTLTNMKPVGDGMITSFLEDRKGNIWVGTRNHGACRYDGTSFTDFADVAIFGTCAVYGIAEDQAGNIWFGTESGRNGEGSGAWCYNPSIPGTKAFTNLGMKAGVGYNSIFTVLADRSGTLWFGTRNIGLFSYDPAAAQKAGFVTLIDYAAAPATH